MKLTEEQERILEAVLTSKGAIVGNAFAGTGKTTLCLEALKRYSETTRKTVLYLVYNRSMKEEVVRRLNGARLTGVIVNTAHGLAYGYVKPKNLGNLKVVDVAKLLNLELEKAALVLRAYASFLHEDAPLNAEEVRKFLEQKFQEENVEFLTKKVLSLITAIEQGVAPMPHDHYLKKFVENVAPKLKGHFGLIILDESQDANPIILKLLKTLEARTTLLVGDKHQKIYGFRKAVDASKHFPTAQAYYLTQSFRFNEEVASSANQVLAFKGEKERVKGIGQKRTGKVAHVSRTNAGVIKNVLRLNTTVKTERKVEEVLRPALTVLYVLSPKTFYSLGFNESQIDLVLASSFPTPQKLEEYVRLAFKLQVDAEVSSAFFLVEELLEKGKAYELKKVLSLVSEDSHVVCTTAHASKGLEYDEVYVGEDMCLTLEEVLGYLCGRKGIFPTEEELSIALKGERIKEELITAYAGAYEAVEEELNLRYVAFTRASRKLHRQDNLSFLLKKAQDVLEKIKASRRSGRKSLSSPPSCHNFL